MKAVFLLLICCLAFHNGKGAPRKAVYKFVRCNPDGDQANCVTQQTTEMPWSPDLPAKLPASAAQYLKTEPVEDERPPWEEKYVGENQQEVEETPVTSEDGESAYGYQGSGGYEGSGVEDWYMADRVKPADRDMGSGRSFMDIVSYKVKKGRGRKLDPSFIPGESKPTEQDLKEDHLLNF